MPKKKSKSLEQLELEEMLGPSSDSNESQKSKSDLINAGQVASHSRDNSVAKSSQVVGLNSANKRGKNNNVPSKKSNLPPHAKVSRLSLSSDSSDADNEENPDNAINFDINANADMNNNNIKSKKSKDKTIADPNLPSNKSDIPNWFPDPGSKSWAVEAV